MSFHVFKCKSLEDSRFCNSSCYHYRTVSGFGIIGRNIKVMNILYTSTAVVYPIRFSVTDGEVVHCCLLTMSRCLWRKSILIGTAPPFYINLSKLKAVNCSWNDSQPLHNVPWVRRNFMVCVQCMCCVIQMPFATRLDEHVCKRNKEIKK